VRRHTPALSTGRFRLLDLPDDLLGYERTEGEDTWLVLINLSERAIGVGDPTGTTADHAGTGPTGGGAWQVAVSSDGTGEGRPFTGTVGGDQAVLLHR
jgi:alpha-glucosidase